MIITSWHGFISGFIFASLTATLQVRLIDEHSSLQFMAYCSLVTSLYAIKFLFAPFFDVYRPLWLKNYTNHYCGWIMICQLTLILGLMGLAYCNLILYPSIFLLLLFVTTLFSCFQDVNIDAFRNQQQNKDTLSRSNYYYLICFRIGLFTAASVAVYVSSYLSWKTIYLIMALTIVVGLRTNLMPRALKSYLPLITPTNLFKAAVKDLASRTPYILLGLLLITYGLGDALTLSINSLFLLSEIHLSKHEFVLYANCLNMGMLLLSTLVVRYLLNKFKLSTLLYFFSLVQSIALGAYILLSYNSTSKTLAVLAILIEGFSGGLIASIILNLISCVTRAPYLATQFACLSAFPALTLSITGPFALFFKEYISWHMFYTIALISSFFALMIIYFSRRWLNMINFTSLLSS